MKTVNFILPSYPRKPVGGFSVVYEYANRLVKQGYRVRVIHPLYTKGLPKKGIYTRQKQKAIRVYNRFIIPKIDWHYVDKRVELTYVSEPIEKNIPEADVVIATAWQTAEYVWRYSVEKGKKFYLIQHYETWSGDEEKVNRTWLYPMYKIVIANWLYKLGKEIGIPEEEIRHIPNGIDHDKYYLTKGTLERPKRVAMMYSKTGWKGSVDGIKALEIVRNEHADLNAVLFGVHPRPRGLPAWIEYYQNPPQDFLVNNIYNGSSIYLCPSWAEGWHLPPAEAMACGCAVVATDIGGVHDYAIDNKTALLSPIRTPERLADNIIMLIENDEVRVRLANDGTKNIKSFTWENSAEMLDKYLREVLEKS